MRLTRFQLPVFQNFFNDKNEWQNRAVLADVQDKIKHYHTGIFTIGKP